MSYDLRVEFVSNRETARTRFVLGVGVWVRIVDRVEVVGSQRTIEVEIVDEHSLAMALLLFHSHTFVVVQIDHWEGEVEDENGWNAEDSSRFPQVRFLSQILKRGEESEEDGTTYPVGSMMSNVGHNASSRGWRFKDRRLIPRLRREEN